MSCHIMSQFVLKSNYIEDKIVANIWKATNQNLDEIANQSNTLNFVATIGWDLEGRHNNVLKDVCL